MTERRTRILARQLDAKLTDGPSGPPPSLRGASTSMRSKVRVRPPIWVALGVLVGVGFGARVESTTVDHLEPAFGTFVADAIPRPASSVSGCARSTLDGAVDFYGACEWRVSDPGVTVASLGRSRLHAAGGLLEVERGWLVFDVDKVRHGAPVRIGVAGGTIEVIGTRFSVYQDDVRGHVELVEGKIRMIDRVGLATILTPGDRFTWEVDPSSTIKEPDQSSHPRVRDVDEPNPGSMVGEIDRLRAKGRYREALKLALQLAGQTRDRHAREVLHYEAGTILEDPLGDVAGACRHWAEHLARFVGGRYEDRVRARLSRLSCETTGN